MAQARSRQVVPDTEPALPDLPDDAKSLPLPEDLPADADSPGIVGKPASPTVPVAPAEPKAALPPSSPPPARSRPVTEGPAPQDGAKSGFQPKAIIVTKPTIVTPQIGAPFALIIPTTAGEERIDSRERVEQDDLDHLPYSAIGFIEAVHESGARTTGTGFMIAPGVVVTAAHVLHSPREGAAQLVTFTPGCNGGRINFGATPQTVGRESYRVAEEFIAGNAPVKFDYGILVLPPALWQTSCGFLKFKPIEGSFYQRNITKVTDRFLLAGYPADRTFGTQWLGRGGFLDVRGSVLRHFIDTKDGQSGSPIVAIMRDTDIGRNVPVVVGIHSRYGTSANNYLYNEARRIDAALVTDVRRMAMELGASF